MLLLWEQSRVTGDAADAREYKGLTRPYSLNNQLAHSSRGCRYQVPGSSKLALLLWERAAQQSDVEATAKT